MSDGVEKKEITITRRDFLKLAGLVVGARVLGEEIQTLTGGKEKPRPVNPSLDPESFLTENQAGYFPGPQYGFKGRISEFSPFRGTKEIQILNPGKGGILREIILPLAPSQKAGGLEVEVLTFMPIGQGILSLPVGAADIQEIPAQPDFCRRKLGSAGAFCAQFWGRDEQMLLRIKAPEEVFLGQEKGYLAYLFILQEPKIIVFGDSNAGGGGEDIYQSWSFKLFPQGEIPQGEIPVGVSWYPGATSRDIESRNLTKVACESGAKIFVVAYGTNDLKDFNRMTVKEYIVLNSEAIEKTRGLELKPILIGPVFGEERPEKGYTRARLEEFNYALEVLTQEKDVPFVDLRPVTVSPEGILLPGMIQGGDNGYCHLTAAAHTQIAQLVREKISPLL